VNEIVKKAALHWLKLNAMSTVYAAVGLTAGALTAFIVPVFTDINVWTAFALGFFLPTGPIYLYAASNRCMTRRLSQVKQWKDAGLIADKHCEALINRILEWYSGRVCPGQETEMAGSLQDESPEPTSDNTRSQATE